ncbi:TonB-dependent receptor [Aquimarina sp. U1-2]|uniref:TonB-dependent receptor n=1 Tax=Aquimarina sp. U1-2 TaxID=2823141 RepID=UPI001AECB6BA|nr:TonB-dependent receptor [Aquimarina sp. U1-2]MBP2831448.1 TonB-dependent receptor [Aquimarina sp. U1-2]
MKTITKIIRSSLVLLLLIGMPNMAIANTTDAIEVSSIFQEEYATVTGRVLGDADDPLPGVNVIIRSLNLGNSTDWDGLFTLDRVPNGTYTIEISYLGFETFEQEIEVSGSTIINLGDLVLRPSTNDLGEVIVTANVEGQQKAYNLQRTADNIKTIVSADLVNQFPDINVGEALQRVPGVNIERNNGEGANIRIRGTPRNFTTVSIDGAQLPVTDGGGARTESLDLIPAELLSSMEVTKTPTADMDGDAIGGSVNLKTPTARSRKGSIKGTVAGGYADIFEAGAVRAKLKMDKRFADGKFGILLGGSFYNTVIGEERYETNYDSVNVGESGDPNRYRDYLLNELELRPRENVRTRLGFNTTFDYKFNPTSEVFIKLALNKVEDESERYRIRYRGRGAFLDSSDPTLVGGPGSDARFRKDVADQVTDRENVTFTFGGKHTIASFAKLDYGYSFSRSERFQTVDRTVFRRRGITYRIDQSDRDFPQFIPLDFDPTDISQLEFSAFQRDQPRLTQGRIQTIQTNVAFPFILNTKINGEIKVGGKVRLQQNLRRTTNNQWGNFDGQYFLDQVVGDDQGSIFDGTYDLGAFPSPSRTLQHFNDNFNLYLFNENESAENSLRDTFNVDEDVYATYIQSKFNIQDLTVLLGVRYENTEASYDALAVQNNAGIVTSESVSGAPSFDFFLPNVQLKYALNEFTNIRAAFTQSFARPDLFDLVPRENRSFADNEIREGNPDLQPAFANNFDLSLEHYFATDGIASVGVFHKRIDDFIFQQASLVDGGPFDGWQRFKPVNGEEAELTGVEVALAKKLNFLPGFLSGFGVFLNYTYVTSESTFVSLDEETGLTTTREDIPFVGQAEHTYNAALYYDKKGFSARLSLNYNDSSIDSFTQDPMFDRFLDERYQLDGNASYKINDYFTVFVELQNLLDDPVVLYEEVRERVLNYERYGWTGRLGVNFKF